jgi:hypothetical protein
MVPGIADYPAGKHGSRAPLMKWSACIPGDFFGIGQFYADFSQTTDDEVIACLQCAAAEASRPPAAPVGRASSVS